MSANFRHPPVRDMFRRRCSSILVVDAGADEACSLFDLGNAIRKAEIEVTQIVQTLEAKGDPGPSGDPE